MKFNILRWNNNTTKLLLLHLISHIGVVYSFFVGELWMFIAAFIWWQFVAATSIASGYHRYYSHHSFKTGKWYEHYVNIIGMFANPGPVFTWASVHRQHHRHTDKEKDPHSYVHQGWFPVYFNTWGWFTQIEKKFAKPYFRDKTVMFYYKHYFKIIVAMCVILFLIDPLLFVFGWCWTAFFAFHGYGIINILGHRGGKPRNSAIANILTAGEGWHEYHHKKAADWKNGDKWWQWDFAGVWIRLIKHS